MLTVCCARTLCTSTIGVSPVTVIVSSSAPTFRSPFTVATNDAGQLDAFAPDGAEARQRERHRIGAGPQIDDAVLARVVGDDRADLFDQRRAGGFDRHARQDAARVVLDDAGNGSGELCGGCRRQKQEHEQDDRAARDRCGSLNIAPPYCTVSGVDIL